VNSAPDAGHVQADLRQQHSLQRLTEAREAADSPGTIQAAEHQAVEAHLNLATALARRYQYRGVDFEDLLQLARLGLVKAVKRWRPEIGGEFLPFAYPTILGEIRRYFRDHGSSIRIPRSLRDQHVEVQTLAEELEQRLGHTASDAELAEASGVSVDKVNAGRVAVAGRRVLSLDELAVGSAAAERPSAGAELDLLRVEDLILVRQAMDRLTDRERKILRLRYLDEMSQLKIGEAIGVSQMQVSRLVRAVLAKLRDQIDQFDEIPRLAG
jgi:RNA polymerase sigma-B factor